MLKINVKEIIERQLSKYHREKLMTKQEKIDTIIENMKFNTWMYEKHKKAKNNRYDKKSLNYNQWNLIENIESIKRKG